MKTTVITSILFLFIFFQANAQIDDYDPNQLLISFEPDTDPAHIQMWKDTLHASELWISPITQTRLWIIPDTEFGFEFELDGETMIIENIIDAFTGVHGNRDNDPSLSGGGLNLKASVTYFGGGPAGNVPGMPCRNKFDYYHEQGEVPVKISILDSGATLNIEGSSIYPFEPEVEQITEYLDPSNNGEDQNNHGTHILSVINYIANKETGEDHSQIKYDVRRILNAENRGNVADLILAAEEAVVDGANIINLSLGFQNEYGNDFFIAQLLEALEDLNVLVIASAGNSGIDLNESDWILPASLNYGNFVTVGAVRCNARIAGFSNFGTLPVDLGMAGISIDGYGKEGDMISLTGTSQAAAIVSGIAGVLGTHQETFNAYEIKCALMEGVDVYGSLEDKFASAGVVNASDSYELIMAGCDEIYGETAIVSGLSKKEDLNQSSVYPNPARNILNLILDQGTYNIDLMNLQGVELLSTKMEIENDESHVQMNISDYRTPGVYFLSVQNIKGKVQTHKIIIE